MINKYKKYKTRVGHDVTIYEVYTEGEHPVHGAYFFDGAWTLEAWTSNGYTMAGTENENDIFEAEIIDGSLVARLRAEEINEFAAHPEGLLAEAADRIEQLEAALKFVRENLYAPEPNCSCHISPPCQDCIDHSLTREILETARAALGEKKDV
jgi:hypothetical protein